MIELNEKQKLARSKICLPLDGLDTIDQIKSMVEELSHVVGMFKIGKETFTRFGVESIKVVHDKGCEVFLDLKYHDIPNTVKGASKAATELGVYMFNVHASGGSEMLKAAVSGVDEAVSSGNVKRKPKIIAVTVLTSIDKNILNNELGINGEVEKSVLRFAKMANDSGLDGVVCSAADLYAIKDKLPDDFMYVTPGIKSPSGNVGSDQKRVFTPGNAVSDGSTILVIGRAITGAEDRVKAAIDVIDDMVKSMD